MKFNSKIFILSILVAWISIQLRGQEKSRWKLSDEGGITWEVAPGDTHKDHFEMSGFKMSAIVHYGVDDGTLTQKIHLVFPMLRTIPNDTHASLAHEIDLKELQPIKIDGKPVSERPHHFFIKGFLGYASIFGEGVEIRHQLFPSIDRALFIDKVTIQNPLKRPVEVDIPDIDFTLNTDPEKGVAGSYTIAVRSSKKGVFLLEPGESLHFAMIYSGRQKGVVASYVSADFEWQKRNKLIEETFSSLRFNSPDTIVNRAYNFAKLRAVESIYDTKGGLMHGPGGGRYYAAIWANDQAEYANPFFPFLGNIAGNESAMNSFRHFARYMNPKYEPIPSSIIAEGTDFWNGAGDRGDMAMIAYGASRFALASGDIDKARELWTLIEWCLEYCKRKINEKGVVNSDSDELEGRFPAGEANLNTSCLYYDALISSVHLAKELGLDQAMIDDLSSRASEIEKAIEDFFGRKVAGYETYRYYEDNQTLRAWICTPLTVDIFKRSTGTIDALFSDQLWTEDGLASVTGSTTFWDRATLYALRGVIAAGETRRAMPFFISYSKRRLLGDHVPYPVEAYPEGNQRHLSAESALYCRIITEGLFGIRPTGLRSFKMSPRLPDDWEFMRLEGIEAFGNDFDLEVIRIDQKVLVRVVMDGIVLNEFDTEHSKSFNVTLPN